MDVVLGELLCCFVVGEVVVDDVNLVSYVWFLVLECLVCYW